MTRKGAFHELDRITAELTKLKTGLAFALEQRTTDWARIKELDAENSNYSERVHSLEEENGRYWESIGEHEKQIKTLKDTIENLNAVINKLAKQIP